MVWAAAQESYSDVEGGGRRGGGGREKGRERERRKEVERKL